MRRFWLVFSQAVTVLLAAYFVVSTLKPDWIGRTATLGSTGIALIEAPAQPLAPPPAGSFRLAAQRSLEIIGIDIGSSRGHDHFLLSALEVEVPGFIERADVAGAIPALLV